jgi:two-component system phosphate regulon sensor histidine kinase PhoR
LNASPLELERHIWAPEAVIALFKKDRTSRLRALRIYLLLIVLCTVVLVSFSILSFREQYTKATALPSTHAVVEIAKRELWFVGFSGTMSLSVLGISLFLFARVSWDLRWFQLRSDFVSGVSHEFKTPLSLIRLYSETLASDDSDFSPDDRKNYVRIIARESERLSRLIDNVLDFSRMEKGYRSQQRHPGDLTPVVTQAISDYSDYLTWRGFEVKSSLWPQLPPVEFDREQVYQMLLNLMENARKYSGKSRIIRENLWVQANEVVIEVQDSGFGIPPEEIDKIFQPFYRASRGHEKGGCGLGLYLVDRVMKEHGGRVEVESEVDRGSRFRLIFPVSRPRMTGFIRQKRHLFSKAQPEQ